MNTGWLINDLGIIFLNRSIILKKCKNQKSKSLIDFEEEQFLKHNISLDSLERNLFSRLEFEKMSQNFMK